MTLTLVIYPLPFPSCYCAVGFPKHCGNNFFSAKKPTSPPGSRSHEKRLTSSREMVAKGIMKSCNYIFLVTRIIAFKNATTWPLTSYGIHIKGDDMHSISEKVTEIICPLDTSQFSLWPHDDMPLSVGAPKLEEHVFTWILFVWKSICVIYSSLAVQFLATYGIALDEFPIYPMVQIDFSKAWNNYFNRNKKCQLWVMNSWNKFNTMISNFDHIFHNWIPMAFIKFDFYYF